jgi:hypothetical protein
MAKSYICSIFLFIGSCFHSFGQISFEKTYGTGDWSYCSAAISTGDGGYLIAGHTQGAGSLELFVVKTDSIGDTLWTRIYSTPSNDRCSSVQETFDGGYILTGYSQPIGSTNSDIFLLKINNSGNQEWMKTFDSGEADQASAIFQNSDSGFILTGTIRINLGQTQAFLMRTNSFGDSLWVKRYIVTSGDVGGTCVRQTVDGGFIITGSMSLIGSNTDVYFQKTDSSGNLLWARSYGNYFNEYGKYFIESPDGGFLIAGLADTSFISVIDMLLIKTDSVGDTLWTNIYPSYDEDRIESIISTTDGGYILTGNSSFAPFTNSDAFLVKIDSSAQILWSKSYGGSDIDNGENIFSTGDGGYVIAGSLTIAGNSYSDFSMIKTDAMGVSGCNETSQTFSQPKRGLPNVVQVSILTDTCNFSISSPGFTEFVNSNTSVLCLQTGIEETLNPQSMTVYPISQNRWEIFFGIEIQSGLIELYSLHGQLILQENIQRSFSKIIRTPAPGMYVIRIFDGRSFYTSKFIDLNR